MNGFFVPVGAFFPSWRFFDEVSAELCLEVSFGAHEGSLGPWVNPIPPIQRSFKNLILNPRANYLHACHSLLSRLQQDLSEIDPNDPESLMERTTYKLVQNLIHYQLQELKMARPPYVYRFRLTANGVRLIESPTHETEA